MIFGPHRDVLAAVDAFLEFFSSRRAAATARLAGWATCCFASGCNTIMQGKGTPADLAYLKELGQTIKTTARCGLGQTSANPVLTTLKSFGGMYEALVSEEPDGLKRSFDCRRRSSRPR